MAVNFIDPKKLPTMQEYHLRGKVKVIDKGYVTFKGKQCQDRMCLFIPEDNSQFWKFMHAWSFDPTVKTHQELAAFIGHPLYGPGRVALRRPDEWHDRPYLFIMSSWWEDVLVNKEGETIEIQILPEDQDELVDQSKY